MQKSLLFAVFGLGTLVGAVVTIFVSSKAEQSRPNTGSMIHVESMLLAKQYEMQRENGAWPQPTSITSYLTHYEGSSRRTMKGGKDWRVDIYRIGDGVQHFYRYLLIGLDPDGTGYFLEERNDAPT